jgi:exopolysaccharide biosynthesis predicted pyruvyltransferase EpsI
MLLPFSYFDPIFLPLQGKKVHFVEGSGNVGDLLINESTHQLFKHYKIDLVDFDESEIVVFGGGGNFGSNYYASKHRKEVYEKIRQGDKPREAIILPQSVYTAYNNSTEQIPEFVNKFYTRDKKSQQLVPNSILAPDIALSYTYQGHITPPTQKQGILLA